MPLNYKVSDLLKRIERVMYGYNYAVTLGTDAFTGNTESDFQKELKIKYPNSAPESNPLRPIESELLLEDIIECFDYRGDETAGLTLKDKTEKELKSLQQEYLQHLKQLTIDANCFLYPSFDGIPGYPVFWEYSYVIFKDGNIIFIYGSSSD